MFRKKNKPETAAKKPSGRGLIPSVISKDMHILGNLVSDGAIDFNGTIDGNIRCATLTVRSEGIVKGEITADKVCVYGKVVGLIKSGHAQLYSSCHIEGIVMHESITIEDGAFIDGKCKRTNKPATVPSTISDEAEEEDSMEGLPKIMDNIRLIS
ncbi:MAG: polymer-forming cytoskeletal protein [Alphaproteobacteria bacterium]